MMDPSSAGRSSAMYTPGLQSLKPSTSFNGMMQPNRSKSGDFRFIAGTFQYNLRVAIALVPCMLLLLAMGGKPVLGTLTIGLMVSYILDSLQLTHGAFFGIWGSIFASQLAFVIAGTNFFNVVSRPLYWLALFVSFEANFLVGIWASLQFRWLQMENPSVVLALERVLFACLPFTAATILTWGVVAAIGIEKAAFYLMVILFGLYWMFSLPHQSSFRSKTEKNYGGQVAEEALILGPLDAVFHTLTLLFMPLLFYFGSHHALFFTSLNSVCEMLMLFFIPLLFQLYASTRGGLWWLAKDPKQFHQVRLVNGAISLFVVTICLEIRVVFYAFGQYIHIPAPWSYIFVTVALLGGVLALGAYAMGLVSDAFSSVLLTGAMMLASFSGSLVVGLPLKFIPAPLVAAFYISHFCVKRSLFSYFIFAVTASLPITWFVVHNFWYLNVWLGGVPLKTICKHLIGSSVLALVIPGFILLSPKAHRLGELALIAHALLVCNLENKFYNFGNMYFYGFDNDDVVYPSYLVISTTVIGLLLVRRLAAANRIDSLAAWALTCLYSAKLSLLFLASKYVLWATVVLLLAISPPLLLYRDKGKGGSRMKPWQAFLHATTICVSVWLCRYTIFDAIQGWMGRPPSDGMLLGSIILLCGLANIPIVTHHFPHVQSVKRILILVIALGLLLVFMEPPVPKMWKFWWDSSHMPEHLIDDEAIYGIREQKPTWPSWLLIFALVTSLAAFTSAIPVQYFVELRLFYAIGLGIVLGVYVCTQFFMQSTILHALLVGATVCASIFVVFTHLPSASSPRFLPWIFALFVSLFPVMYFLEGQLRLNTEDDDEKLVALLALEGSRTSLLGLYATIFMLIALQIKYELASLLREKALEKGGRSWASGTSTAFVPKYRLLQQRHQPTFTVKKLAAEGAWMPAVGNVATCLCFLMCLILNIHLTGGSNRSIFFLAPILLLLNQDSNLLTGFGDRQRYFPLTFVISAYLAASGAYTLLEEVWFGYQNAAWGLETGGPGLFYAVKNALLLFLTIPNHVIFNRFMWDYVKQSDFKLLLITPLNLPAIIITDIMAIRALALLGLIYALVQYLVSRQIRISGMKFI